MSMDKYADLLVLGNVITMDKQYPSAEAVAVDVYRIRRSFHVA